MPLRNTLNIQLQWNSWSRKRKKNRLVGVSLNSVSVYRQASTFVNSAQKSNNDCIHESLIPSLIIIKMILKDERLGIKVFGDSDAYIIN